MKSYLKLDYNKFNQKNLNKILLNFGNPKKIKILYISTYNPEYTRTETILDLFKKNNITYKTILPGKGKYFQAIKELIKNQKDYDLIFLGFRGQEIFPLIKLFAKKPIIFDSFISLWDTLCLDRKKISPNSILGKSIKKFEKWEYDNSAAVLFDTLTHKNFITKEFNINNADYLYVGSNEDLFKQKEIKRDTKIKTIFWYGNVLPLQGVDIILKTAKLLEKNKNINFKLIGPIKKKYLGLINSLDLKNVDFIEYVAYKNLSKEINKSDLCLGGHFSNIEKAKRVIPGKSFQFLSCKKITILGDNLANREIFKESELVKFVKMNDEKALAEKILEILG